jgi:hypothetical protein
MHRHSYFSSVLLALPLIAFAAEPSPAAFGRFDAARPEFGLGVSVESWRPHAANESNALVLVDARLFLAPTLALQGELGYWRNTSGNLATRKATDIPFGANLVFLLPLAHAADVYAGGGAARHSWTLEGESVVGRTAKFTDNGIGGQVLTGFEGRVAHGVRIFAELRYTFGTVHHFADTFQEWQYDGPAVGIGLHFYSLAHSGP